MPWDATGMIELITCGQCGKQMRDAKIEDEIKPEPKQKGEG
jgi:hypothetical protein